MAEHLTVAQVVVGSRPIIRPKKRLPKSLRLRKSTVLNMYRRSLRPVCGFHQHLAERRMRVDGQFHLLHRVLVLARRGEFVGSARPLVPGGCACGRQSTRAAIGYRNGWYRGFLAWRDAGLNPYGNSIIVNAKCQRPSVCNAAESLLVHAAQAPAFLPR